MFKIDPQYRIIDRMIDTDGVNDIKAINLEYINYEVNHDYPKNRQE